MVTNQEFMSMKLERQQKISQNYKIMFQASLWKNLEYAQKERSHQIWRHIQTESEGIGTGFHTSGNQKKPGIAIFISDK